MSLFVCSDIHSNLRAFDSVLAAYREEPPCEFLFLGDAIGYGAHPLAVLDRLMDIPRSRFLMGNHDWAVLDAENILSMSEMAAEVIEWTLQVLEGRHRDLIFKRFSFLSDGKDHIASHASPLRMGEWEYIYSTFAADEVFEKMDFRLCFVGHTHIPIVYNSRSEEIRVSDGDVLRLERGVRYIVNPGSVGQPRDGDPRASFCIYEPSEKTLSFHRREYDIEAEASDIIGSGLPSSCAERLRLGV